MFEGSRGLFRLTRRKSVFFSADCYFDVLDQMCSCLSAERTGNAIQKHAQTGLFVLPEVEPLRVSASQMCAGKTANSVQRKRANT